MLIRLLTIAATVVGGAVLARRVADNVVETQVNKEIEAAKEEAILRLGREAGVFSRRRLAEFFARTLKKTAILSFFAVLYHLGEISADGIRIILGATIAVMLVGDVSRIARPAWLGFQKLRSSRWRAAKALKEFVAALAFEEAYQHSLTQLTSPQISPVLFISTFTRAGVSEQVAKAISEVAHDATVQQVRPHLIFFFCSAAAILSIYSVFVFSTFSSIS